MDVFFIHVTPVPARFPSDQRVFVGVLYALARVCVTLSLWGGTRFVCSVFRWRRHVAPASKNGVKVFSRTARTSTRVVRLNYTKYINSNKLSFVSFARPKALLKDLWRFSATFACLMHTTCRIHKLVNFCRQIW